VHCVKTVTASRVFRVAAPTIWNNLPDFVKVADSCNVFKRRLNVNCLTLLFKQPFYQPAALSRSLTTSELRCLKLIKLYCIVWYCIDSLVKQRLILSTYELRFDKQIQINFSKLYG